MPKLSGRLRAIAEIVEKGSSVCDIGTDHAYLPIYLKESGRAKTVIATDLNELPLKKAKENIKASKTDGIELRHCDGLSGIKSHEADTVIISGMGGDVISGILERGTHITKQNNVKIIMQPTTSPEVLRKFLCENGYEILNEIAVFENAKLYSIILAKYAGKIFKADDCCYYIGKLKPETKAAVLYIKKQQKRCFECMNALESITEKRELYNHYKKAFEGITYRLEKDITEN